MAKKALILALIVGSILLGAWLNRESVIAGLRVPAHRLVVRHAPLPSDSIFVLSGGRRTDRTDLAASLYKSGYSGVIYLCSESIIKVFGGWLGTKKFPSGQYYRRQLVDRGVDVKNIRLVDCRAAPDTKAELQEVAAILRQSGAKRVLLVSSASHSRRVSLIWGRINPGIEGIIIGARDPYLENWWHSKRGVRVLFYEYSAMIKEYIRRIWE